jgi:hypothetical protein
MPLLVAMVTVIRTREVYQKKRDLNYRIVLMVSLLWIAGWTVGLVSTILVSFIGILLHEIPKWRKIY